ncbi:DUF6455 family protein [Bosea thiooxidans]
MRFAEPVRHWLRAQISSREIDALDPATLRQLARDNGVTEVDFHDLATRQDGNAELLRRQLAQAGIDTGQLAHTHASVMRDMEIVCSGCLVTRRCRRALDHREGAQHAAQYCPNAHTIDALRAGAARFC